MLRLGMRNGEIIGIGSLEAKVLRSLYEHRGWVTVTETWERLRQDIKIDRSTVITCLTRMADKGYLEGRKDEQGVWSFKPALSAYEFGLALIQTVWENIWGPPPAALSRFVTDALTGKLGEEGVPEEMKEVARQTEDLRQLVEDFSSPGLPASGEEEHAESSAPGKQTRSVQQGRRRTRKPVPARS